MAFTYPRAWPALRGVAEIAFTPFSVSAMNVSPLSLEAQVYGWPGERWEVDVSFVAMKRADAERWIAFFTSLRGKVGSFTLGDPAGQVPRGTASGSVTATGDERARTVTLSGGSGTLLEGDWISFDSHRRLHKVLADVTLGGSVSCEIWPSLRATLSSAPVALSGAKGRFMLMEPPRWSIGLADIYRPPSIKAYEDRRP